MVRRLYLPLRGHEKVVAYPLAMECDNAGFRDGSDELYSGGTVGHHQMRIRGCSKTCYSISRARRLLRRLLACKCCIWPVHGTRVALQLRLFSRGEGGNKPL
jgi:hypothetical protein